MPCVLCCDRFISFCIVVLQGCQPARGGTRRENDFNHRGVERFAFRVVRQQRRTQGSGDKATRARHPDDGALFQRGEPSKDDTTIRPRRVGVVGGCMLGSSRRRRGRDGDARITYRVGDRRPEHESKRCIERSHRRGLPSRVRRQRTFVAFSYIHVHGNTTGAVLTKATQLLPTHFYFNPSIAHPILCPPHTTGTQRRAISFLARTPVVPRAEAQVQPTRAANVRTGRDWCV